MQRQALVRVAFAALVLVAPLFAQDFDPYSLEAFAPANFSSKKIDTELGVVRQRYVRVNTNLFSKKNDFLGDRSAPGSVVELNLFEDVFMTGVLERSVENQGTWSWVGSIAEEEISRVSMVIDEKNSMIMGNIVTPHAFYQIRWVADGVHAIREVDQGVFPEDAEPVVSAVRDAGKAAISSKADSGSVIDILVVYTPAARSAQGGTTAIQNLVDLAVTETNQGYNNSNVNFQLNLVYKGEISYTESSNFSTNLSRLTGKTDGYMDNVHSLRDQYCADMVALIINGSQYCGIANLMTSVSPSFEDRAFSVTARTCATGYYSFGHELGHNMGARHDWYVDGNTTPYIYNHGYTYPSANWRTIMAYNNACSAAGTSCTRLDYWSNPNVTYGGQPMGVGGSTVGSSANNALALNNSASTVANFRDSTNPAGCGGEEPPPSECNGTQYTGTLTGSGDYEYEPNGTYYFSSASGFHEADLEGAAGTDFDLYLWKWNGSSWSTVASSTSASSSESISYNGSSGYYVWRVYSYSGSGDYTLCTRRP
ncbi:MAG: M12 family metallo-peptidase [Acidobacteriota bacterium]|nr:M12 family metallo-peptidase [Acidobacteriota bacterium]